MNLEIRVEREAESLLVRNRKRVGRHVFTTPSDSEYRHQWLWDSCFHAIALRHFDPEMAEAELLSIVASQHRNGMVPHESKHTVFNIPVPYTSTVTQPPFIARAALDVYAISGNNVFLSQMFPSMHRYHQWLANKRELAGVINVVSPLESGEDNSLPWDSKVLFPLRKAYGFVAAHVPLMPNLTGLRSVTVTAIYADALSAMAEIAGILGDEGLAAHYIKKNKEVVEAMRREFRQEDGLFYHKDSDGSPVRHLTHAIFSPLFAGALSNEEVEQLVKEHLLNPGEFWTPYPIPTVAKSEPKFSPTAYWRGPTWVNMNWMHRRGLLRYGFRNEADQLLQKTTAAIGKNGFREYYNPLTGEGLGARNFGWSTLVIDMMKA